MHADALLLALHEAGIVIEADGNALRWHGPKDAMTTPLAAALKEHKVLLLAIFATLGDRARDADWDLVRAWLIDDAVKTFTRPMMAAAKRIHLPVHENEWPEAFARRFRAALRVRGVLRVFDPPMVAPITREVGT